MKTSLRFLLGVALIVCLTVNRPGRSCTSILVTRGASTDGSTMITYAADAHVLYGELYFTPAGRHAKGAKLEVYEWDTGKYLGQIDQVPRTYSVVGNMNEHQLAISETTFGGRKELHNPDGIMDYGSLIYITLQRAKTAREAIDTMAALVDQYGYASSGESLSISDPNEVWIMEIIGKGPKAKGALWVARRIPDGYISAHANQARIRQFPLGDPKNCRYAKDVISFARNRGYFAGKDADFSFADAYAPLDFGALRFCEARVWSVFNRAARAQNISLDYVMAKEGAAPMPLWVKPDKKLSVGDVMALMRDHFQGTALDMTADVGAGPYVLPYRWRPLTWKVDGVEYFNERAISTQQTGFSFVSQSRAWLPDPIGGVLWFGVDDTYSTVYVPMYCGIREAPFNFAVGTGDFDTFTWDSAFWVFNVVSNYAYARYSDMIGDIQKVQQSLEGAFLGRQKHIEDAARELYGRSPELARDYLTEYSSAQAKETVTRWRALSQALFVKYLDGNVRDEKGKVTHPGYPESWYQHIVDQKGDHFRVKQLKGESDPSAPLPRCQPWQIPPRP